MFPIDRCIHRNSRMIKEGQKMQWRDKKQTLKNTAGKKIKQETKTRKNESKQRKLHRLHINRE